MPRRFSAEFKFEVVRQIETNEKRLCQVCREHDLDAAMVRNWRQTVNKRGEQAFPRSIGSIGDENTEQVAASELASAQARIGELERLAGKQALEVEFLKKVLRKAGCPLPRGLS